MNIKRNRRADEERKAYSLQDIDKIYKNLPRDNNTPERFWIPMICMFSGMRLNEACQLYKEDITKVDGIWCFDVNDSKDKKLKNLSSKRIIPIHPSLIEFGIIEEVSQRADGDRLWFNLKWNKISGYSNSLGKWYQRFNREFITNDLLKTFHSLRHSFADTLKQVGISEIIIAEILGHELKNITTGRYGKRYRPKTLLLSMIKLNYKVVKY